MVTKLIICKEEALQGPSRHQLSSPTTAPGSPQRKDSMEALARPPHRDWGCQDPKQPLYPSHTSWCRRKSALSLASFESPVRPPRRRRGCSSYTGRYEIVTSVSLARLGAAGRGRELRSSSIGDTSLLTVVSKVQTAGRRRGPSINTKSRSFFVITILFY